MDSPTLASSMLQALAVIWNSTVKKKLPGKWLCKFWALITRGKQWTAAALRPGGRCPVLRSPHLREPCTATHRPPEVPISTTHHWSALNDHPNSPPLPAAMSTAMQLAVPLIKRHSLPPCPLILNLATQQGSVNEILSKPSREWSCACPFAFSLERHPPPSTSPLPRGAAALPACAQNEQMQSGPGWGPEPFQTLCLKVACLISTGSHSAGHRCMRRKCSFQYNSEMLWMFVTCDHRKNRWHKQFSPPGFTSLPTNRVIQYLV